MLRQRSYRQIFATRGTEYHEKISSKPKNISNSIFRSLLVDIESFLCSYRSKTLISDFKSFWGMEGSFCLLMNLVDVSKENRRRDISSKLPKCCPWSPTKSTSIAWFQRKQDSWSQRQKPTTIPHERSGQVVSLIALRTNLMNRFWQPSHISAIQALYYDSFMTRMKRSRLPSWFHRKRRQGFKWWVFNNGDLQSKYGRPKSIRR